MPASTLVQGPPRFCAMTGRPLNPYTVTPAPQAGPDHRPTHADTNAAINSMNQGGGDEEMTDADSPIIGGRVVIVGRLSDVALLAARAVGHFQKIVRENEMARRIKRASVAPALDSAADRIADAVKNERPADRPVLRGLVQSEAERVVDEMKREIQSLRSRLDNQEKKSGKKTGKKNPQAAEKKPSPTNTKDFRRRGGKAAKTGPAPNQTRGSPPAHGNATIATGRKPLSTRSAAKQNGKPRARPTKSRK